VTKNFENIKCNIFPKNGINFHNIGFVFYLIAFFLKKSCSNGMIFANSKRITS